jgi:hypothetical protein
MPFISSVSSSSVSPYALLLHQYQVPLSLLMPFTSPVSSSSFSPYALLHQYLSHSLDIRPYPTSSLLNINLFSGRGQSHWLSLALTSPELTPMKLQTKTGSLPVCSKATERKFRQ